MRKGTSSLTYGLACAKKRRWLAPAFMAEGICASANRFDQTVGESKLPQRLLIVTLDNIVLGVKFLRLGIEVLVLVLLELLDALPDR